MTDEASEPSAEPDASTETDPVLLDLLEGNARHVDSLPADYYDPVQEGQHPEVVTICCADSRVPQEGMWAFERPGSVFTPSNIGNQAWDDHDGSKIVDGSLLYPVHFTETNAIAVVGHTGCGAVTAAHAVATGDDPPGPQGVTKWIDMLVPVIERGLQSGLVGSDTAPPEIDAETWVINQLVEYNVDHQASFLRNAEDVPRSVSVYGFVYDFHGVYGNDPGRAYLVNLEGETHPDRIRAEIPLAYAPSTSSLLYGTTSRE